MNVIPTTTTINQTRPSSGRESISRLTAEREIQDLQSQLNSERELLAQRAQDLAVLEDQRRNQTQSLAIHNQSQISERNLEIQSLNQMLQAQQGEKEDLQMQTDAWLRDQSEQAQILRDQIDQNISAVESALRDVQRELWIWSQPSNNITEQQARISELRTQLEQLQLQLQDLRTQRSNMATQIYLQGREIDAQAQAARTDLRAEEDSIRTQIQNLRRELVNLSQSRQQQATTGSLLQEIQAAQAARNEQAERVQNLEGSLRDRQSELQRLR